MKNMKRQKYGFSLMEMMVVLLIISIIMAATAPMVAKKMATDRANGGSPWVFTSNNGNIGFNIAGNNVSAIIGAAEISGRPNNIVPRLIINGSNTQPVLAFASGSAYVGQLTVDGANNSVGISDDHITNGSVALGLEQSIGNTNTIAIGNGITTTNNGEINVGDKFKYDGSTNITLGNNSDVVNIPGSLQLNGLTSTNSVNYLRYVEGSHRLTLGTASDTIYIPGKVILGSNSGAVYAYVNNKDSYMKFRYMSDGNKAKTDKWYTYGNILSDTELGDLTSDIRLKHVGSKYTAGIEELKKLDIFNYTFKYDKTNAPHVGVIAQDLEKVFPNSVTTDQTGYLRIRWDEMFYAVINAVKELDTKIAELSESVKSYFDKTSALEAKIEEQQKTIEQQQASIEKLVKQVEKLNTDFEKNISKCKCK